MNDVERVLLIQHRIEKANKMIEEVGFQIENAHYETAINRMYYGMFYILNALALHNKFSTTKHSQLIGWFNKEFIKSGKLKKELGQAIFNAYEMRSKSDYDDFITYDKADILALYDSMKLFISEIVKEIDIS